MTLTPDTSIGRNLREWWRWTISKSRPLHVVCAPKPEYLAVITVYDPRPEKWEPDFRTRRR